MGKTLGMASDSKELQGIISHYQKLGNSDELLQELSKAIETAFKNNPPARDNYIQKLQDITDKKDSTEIFSLDDSKEVKENQDDHFERKFKKVENIEQEQVRVNPKQEQIDELKEFKNQVELAKLQATQQQIANSVESVNESQGKSL